MPRAKKSKSAKKSISKEVEKVTEQYGLYYTINKNIPSKNMTTRQLNKLKAQISEISDIEHKEALIHLIIEHARVHDGYVIDVEDPTLPYGMESITKSKKAKNKVYSLQIDTNSLPPALLWILDKYLSITK